MQHTYHQCHCGMGTCQYCGGGLAYCTTCGGFEGTLTTDCPGFRMGELAEAMVYHADWDFRGGQWVLPGYKLHIVKEPPCSPATS